MQTRVAICVLQKKKLYQVINIWLLIVSVKIVVSSLSVEVHMEKL